MKTILRFLFKPLCKHICKPNSLCCELSNDTDQPSEIHQANLVKVCQLKNLVDDYKVNSVHSAEEKNFFGKWAKDLIFTETISPYIIRNGLEEYFEKELIAKNIPIDTNDYYLNRGLFAISQRAFNEALYWFERLSGTTHLHLELLKWKSTKAILIKSIDNYTNTSNTITFPTNFKAQRDQVSIWSGFSDYYKDKFSLLLIKIQSVVIFWDRIPMKSAYIECCLALIQASDLFESLLKDFCLSKNANACVNSINTMVTGELNNTYPLIRKGHDNALSKGRAKTPQDFINEYRMLISHLLNTTTIEEYQGALLHIARVTRNNSMHGVDFNNPIFNTQLDFRLKIDVVIEAILAVKTF